MIARGDGDGVRPPRLAARIVRATLPARDAGSLLADLDERFERMVARRGASAARRWYWRQAAGFALRVPVARALGAFGRDRLRAAPRTTSNGSLRGVVGVVVRDLSYAARELRSRPRFTLPAVAILAIAIAANSAVLSVVDTVLMRDLPYPDPESMVMLWDVRPPESDHPGEFPVSFRHYLEWKERDDLFAGILAMETLQPVVADGHAIRTHGMMVSGGAFELLGVAPALGRPLLPDDDLPGAEPVAMISDRLWRAAFDADPGIVGRAITIDRAPVTVVGVLPPGFWYFDPFMYQRSVGGRETAQPDVWRPLATRDWTDPGWFDYGALRVMARLQPGVSVASARAALETMRAESPLEGDQRRLGVAVVPLVDEVLGEMRSHLLLLQGAVALLVAIACVNVTSLLLAKASARRGELAVRAALGAGRASLVRLAIAESALLGLCGGGVGLIAAYGLGDLVLRIAPRELPLAHRVGIDLRVATLTLGVALLAGVLAGLLPALSFDLRSMTRALRAGARGVAGSVSGSRVRFVLIAVEVALTLVLLIGAVVLLRSFLGAWRTDPGFEPRSALTFQSVLSTPEGEAPDHRFHTLLLDELRALPGVESAGATTHLPFSRWGFTRRVIAGDTGIGAAEAPRVEARWITEGYLDAMGMRLLAGRDFERRDDAGAEPVALINAAFAEGFFPEAPDLRSLLGESIGIVAFGTPAEVLPHRVVGVVDNVKHYRLFESDRPIVYTPLRQDPKVFARFVVRCVGDPPALVDAVRGAAATVDPHQPLNEMYPLRTLVAQSLAEERFYTQLLLAFGVVAFGLAALGVYGSVAYGARLKLREIGVRIAFGARPGSIRRLVVGQGLGPVAVGIVAGCAGAALLVRGLEGLLHGISPIDLPSFGGGAVLFLLVAAAAALVPAQRAAASDPIEVLRSE